MGWNRRRASVAISVGVVAVVMMAGCSKASEPGATSSSAAGASAPAAEQADAGGGWNPPVLTGLDEAMKADSLKDPSLDLAKNCKTFPMEPVTENDLQLIGVTMEEWTAYATYANDFMGPLCANQPAAAPAVYTAAGACDPSAYEYCVTPDMDGTTIEIDAGRSAFIDIAGVNVECSGTGYAPTMAADDGSGDFAFKAIYTMGNPGVAGDAVCAVTGAADGAPVMTLNVTVLDPA